KLIVNPGSKLQLYRPQTDNRLIPRHITPQCVKTLIEQRATTADATDATLKVSARGKTSATAGLNKTPRGRVTDQEAGRFASVYEEIAPRLPRVLTRNIHRQGTLDPSHVVGHSKRTADFVALVRQCETFDLDEDAFQRYKSQNLTTSKAKK